MGPEAAILTKQTRSLLDSVLTSAGIITVSHAALALGLDKAYGLKTGTPSEAITVKDYRANSVHAPFFRTSQQDEQQSRSRPAAFQPAKNRLCFNFKRYFMTATHNPQAAADQTSAAYRQMTDQLGNLGLDTAVPEGVRALAEKTVAQTRETYDRSLEAFDASLTTFERSFDTASQGAAAFNRKIVDIARRNVDASFDLAKTLAGAKNLADMVGLQAAFWRKQFGLLTAQR